MNLIDFGNKIKSLIERVPDTKTKITKRIGARYLQEAIPRTPVLTGLSKNSWWYEHDANQVTIRNSADAVAWFQLQGYWFGGIQPSGNDVFYASFWNSRHFVTPVVTNLIQQEIRDIFYDEFMVSWEGRDSGFDTNIPDAGSIRRLRP